MKLTLNHLRPGQTCVVLHIWGNKALRKRLIEIDVYKRQAVTSVQEAMKGLVAVEKPSTETSDDNKADSTQTGQESTTTKANAAKTGDVAPIAGVMALALTGTALLATRKKK